MVNKDCSEEIRKVEEMFFAVGLANLGPRERIQNLETAIKSRHKTARSIQGDCIKDVKEKIGAMKSGVEKSLITSVDEARNLENYEIRAEIAANLTLLKTQAKRLPDAVPTFAMRHLKRYENGRRTEDLQNLYNFMPKSKEILDPDSLGDFETVVCNGAQEIQSLDNKRAPSCSNRLKDFLNTAKGDAEYLRKFGSVGNLHGYPQKEIDEVARLRNKIEGAEECEKISPGFAPFCVLSYATNKVKKLEDNQVHIEAAGKLYSAIKEMNSALNTREMELEELDEEENAQEDTAELGGESFDMDREEL